MRKELTMTLTKADLADSITNQCDIAKTRSIQLVESILEFIKVRLESGEDVLLSRFGKFCVSGKIERRGRNPATGRDPTLRARKVVTFRCSPVLRKGINRALGKH
jgi:integration host factor subunit alpha